jgi:hypothetical protein
MSEKTRSFLSDNWQWLVTIIFMAGVNFTVIQSKVDSEQVRSIVKEELKETVYSRTDGKVLETRFDAVEKKMDISDKKQDYIINLLEKRK